MIFIQTLSSCIVHFLNRFMLMAVWAEDIQLPDETKISRDEIYQCCIFSGVWYHNFMYGFWNFKFEFQDSLHMHLT